MLGVECWILDHPKAASDFIVMQPCAYIPNSVFKIQQLLSNWTMGGWRRICDGNVLKSFFFLGCTYWAWEGTSYVMLSTSSRQSWCWSCIPNLPHNSRVLNIMICNLQRWFNKTEDEKRCLLYLEIHTFCKNTLKRYWWILIGHN